MLATVISGTTIGLNGLLIRVEVDVYSRGFPQFRVVGLASKAVDESRDRVKTAIKNSGFKFPEGRIVVNLAPADLPKDGSVFDFPIAIGILAASGIIPIESVNNKLFFGELSLDGRVRHVMGGLPIAIAGKKEKIREYFVPQENVDEVTLIDDCVVYAPKNLIEAVGHLSGNSILSFAIGQDFSLAQISTKPKIDFASIKGQTLAKRAAEIAASGGHNLQMVGPPGSGKTMVAKAIMGILPKLNRDEIVDVAQIYSLRREKTHAQFNIVRPFRNPHHTISIVGMVGGGGVRVLPGEVSLAHRGVLFLDEFSEFPRSIIESLRQPLEDGIVTVTRSVGSVAFPARFMLVCASNPCPCGYLNHPKKECVCSSGEVARYQKKLSGPIIDRIDLHVNCLAVDTKDVVVGEGGESSEQIRERVESARQRQRKRFKGADILTNAEMDQKSIKEFCILNKESEDYLKGAIDKYALSARGYFRILKVARSIADIDASEEIKTPHVLEAIQYRVLESR